MKLACVRCKHKKVRCDKGQPICYQCITASAECVYVERRKRPRLAQQKNEVANLKRRLEFVERQLHDSEHTASTSPCSREASTETTEASPQNGVSSEAHVPRESGKESWIYRLATDTTHKFEEVNTQNHATPNDTPDSLIVNDAILGLKDALDDLGKLRLRADERILRVPDLVLSPEEGKACMKIFREMVSSMIIPDIFISNLDLNILEVLPEVANSPYVTVDPAIRVAYYNALFYGLHKLRGPGNPLSKIAYCKVLEAVPEWLNGATGSDLDGHCAALTAWTASNNFDYQLSWKFHRRACHFLKLKGVDRLDSTPFRSNEDEDRRQSLRYLYWLVLQTDLLFRLFYGKPAAIRWKIGKVKPPTLFSVSSMKPTAPQSTCYVVWIRYTVMTAEIFDVLDEQPEGIHTPDVIRQVDEYCSQLDELIEEWNLITLMKASNKAVLSWLYADHIMNIYASIVGIRRLVRRPPTEDHFVDPVTLRAARMVICPILHFNGLDGAPDENYFIFLSFISFYPFCAVFTLYEHILACANPTDCDEDLISLESVGTVMKRACDINPDFNPLSNTIDALNKVSRAMQDSRRNHFTPATSQAQTPAANDTPQASLPANPKSQFHSHQDASNPLPSTIDAFQFDLSNLAPGQAFPSFASLQENPMSAAGELQPLDYLRALENDFIGRNWHETWWDMDGSMDIDGAMGGLADGPVDG